MPRMVLPFSGPSVNTASMVFGFLVASLEYVPCETSSAFFDLEFVAADDRLPPLGGCDGSGRPRAPARLNPPRPLKALDVLFVLLFRFARAHEQPDRHYHQQAHLHCKLL